MNQIFLILMAVRAAAVDFDRGIGAAPELRDLRSGPMKSVRDRIDPTGAPYPASPEAWAAEESRVSQWLAEKLPRLGKVPAAALALARSTGVSDVDLFHGSHVIVRDFGFLYHRWEFMGAVARSSSHYHGLPVAQYEIRLPGMGVLLCGLESGGDTWFQLEPFGIAGTAGYKHVLEYIRHELLRGMNVGPLGLSPRTEGRGGPIVLPGPKEASR